MSCFGLFCLRSLPALLIRVKNSVKMAGAFAQMLHVCYICIVNLIRQRDMRFYIRYSEEIEKDVERGYSFHYTGMDKSFSEEDIESATGLAFDELEYNEEAKQYVQPLAGLCAFELEAETVEEAIEEAKEFRFNEVYNSESMNFFHILTGDYADDCPEGVCITNVSVVYSNTK